MDVHLLAQQRLLGGAPRAERRRLGPHPRWADQLTDHGDLKDHAIRICPDGTYLHTASLNLDEPNDSAYVYRYDGDWNPIGDAVIEEREPARRHNDMPLLCSSVFTGTAFSGSGDAAGFFRISDDLSSERVAGLPREANSTGASMLADKDRGVFEFITTSVEGDLIRFTFDQDFNVVDQRSTRSPRAGRSPTGPSLRSRWATTTWSRS